MRIRQIYNDKFAPPQSKGQTDENTRKDDPFMRKLCTYKNEYKCPAKEGDVGAWTSPILK